MASDTVDQKINWFPLLKASQNATFSNSSNTNTFKGNPSRLF